VHLAGSAEFVASRDDVWKFLIDPSNFGPCSPAPIKKIDDRHFRAETRLGSGLFSAQVTVELEITEVQEGRSARLVGRGGASGTTIEGSTSITLRDGSIDGTTVVDWDAEFTLSGMFAGAAARIIDDRAQDAMEKLLACLHRQIEG
jgi:carbon monoxide dehydrogenase subunit G